MVTCYKCGKEFEPDPVKVKEWVDSELPFDPTDWECPACAEAEEEYLWELQCEQEAEDTYGGVHMVDEDTSLDRWGNPPGLDIVEGYVPF